MRDTRAAQRYASALFGLAMADGVLDEQEEELTRVLKRLSEEKSLWHFLMNPVIGWRVKEEILKKFSGRCSVHFLDFIRVLIRKNRFSLLPDIQKLFHLLYEKQKGIREVRLISARALKSETENRIREVLKTKLRSEIRLIPEVNPKILGGFVVQFEGREVDLSFASRLKEIRHSLLPSAGHGG